MRREPYPPGPAVGPVAHRWRSYWPENRRRRPSSPAPARTGLPGGDLGALGGKCRDGWARRSASPSALPRHRTDPWSGCRWSRLSGEGGLGRVDDDFLVAEGRQSRLGLDDVLHGEVHFAIGAPMASRCARSFILLTMPSASCSSVLRAQRIRRSEGLHLELNDAFRAVLAHGHMVVKIVEQGLVGVPPPE